MSRTSETQKLPAAELFLWQRCKSYAQEFPDPLRPVRSELVAAFVPRAVRLLLLPHVTADLVRAIEVALELIPEQHTEVAAEAGNLLQKYSHDLVSEIVELDTWLHEPGVDETECGNWLTSKGYTYQQVTELLTRAKRHQPGRRPSKRLFTVAALEAQTLDDSRTWRSLVADFCDCAKIEHDKECREALRKSAAQLKSTLKKYRQLPIPAEVVAPLANIFLQRIGWQRSS